MQRLLRYIAWLFTSLAGPAATIAHAAGEPPHYARASELAFKPGWQARIGDKTVGFRVFDAGFGYDAQGASRPSSPIPRHRLVDGKVVSTNTRPSGRPASNRAQEN